MTIWNEIFDRIDKLPGWDRQKRIANATGVVPSYISDLKSGRLKKPRMDFVINLSEVMGFNVDLLYQVLKGEKAVDALFKEHGESEDLREEINWKQEAEEWKARYQELEAALKMVEEYMHGIETAVTDMAHHKGEKMKK